MTAPRNTTARKAAARKAAPTTGVTFTYETSAGQVTLPSLADIKMGIVRRNRNDEVDLIFAAVEDMADEKGLAVLDELTQVEFAQIAKRWQEDSRISMGELQASLS